MKGAFYLRLAMSGIRRSRTVYLPFLLAACGVATVFCMLASLSVSPALEGIGGGRTLRTVLSLGTYVAGFFAVLFLYYTNSFLLRRRKREFGLYNVLGMGKGNLGRILFWENLLTLAVTLLVGIAAGTALSKLSELGLARMLRSQVAVTPLPVFWAVKATVLLFSAVFVLLLAVGLAQVRLSNPIALMRSESAGEKPPHASPLLAVAGVLLLGAAYWIAVTIDDPIQALNMFFVAVLMVIAATYLLFLTGSVALCRLLQKNKRLYYRTDRFVFLSSMTFRMKRSGAGLASICILSTMVLVTLSASACLYFGVENNLRNSYPYQYTMHVEFYDAEKMTPEAIAPLERAVADTLDDMGVNVLREAKCRSVRYPVPLTENLLAPGEAADSDRFYMLRLMPLEDYNFCSGGQDVLASGEILLWSDGTTYPYDRITLGGASFAVCPASAPLSQKQSAMDNTVPTLYLALPSFADCLAAAQEGLNQDHSHVWGSWECALDTDLSDGDQIRLSGAVFDAIWPQIEEDDGMGMGYISRAEERSEFHGMYGGIFFLGLVLSAVFLTATVLIMYYKQTAEGLEDHGRFSIMRKVGMTREDIRSTVNAQMRTVFLLPMGAAVLHLAFAFPMLRRMLLAFDIDDLPLLLTTAGISVAAFLLIYGLFYRLTSNAYYRIVSNDE